MRFIIIVIIAGIIGFVISVIIFSYSELNSPFFEINIANKKIKTENLLNTRIKDLNDKYNILKGAIRSNDSLISILESQKPIDSKMIANLKQNKKADEINFKIIEGNRNKYIKERNGLMFLNVDADSSYFTKYFSVDRSSLFHIMNFVNFNNNSSELKNYIKFNLIDPNTISSELDYNYIIKDYTFLEKVS